MVLRRCETKIRFCSIYGKDLFFVVKAAHFTRFPARSTAYVAIVVFMASLLLTESVYGSFKNERDEIFFSLCELGV